MMYEDADPDWSSSSDSSDDAPLVEDDDSAGIEAAINRLHDHPAAFAILQDAMYGGKGGGKRRKHHRKAHRADKMGTINKTSDAVEYGRSGNKTCPTMKGEASWKKTKEVYNMWLRGCEIASGKELPHIFQYGFNLHTKLQYYAKLFEEENPKAMSYARPKAMRKQIQRSPGPRTKFRREEDEGAPRPRRLTRGEPPENESPDARDGREAREAREDDEDQTTLRAWLDQDPDVKVTEYEDTREQDATGTISVD